MERLIGQLFGAFIITFLLSRLILWLSKNWHGGFGRLVAAHGLSLLICWVAYAFGSADGGPLNWSGGVLYAVPQIIWLIVDVLRKKHIHVARAGA